MWGKFASVAAVLVLSGCGGGAVTASTSSRGAPPPTTAPTFSAAQVESSVVDTCHQAVVKGLKDPDSVRFGEDWKAWKVTAAGSKPPPGMDFSAFNGDEYWNATGMVNAKNSFGGYVGDQLFACDAVVGVGGAVHARAHAA